MMGAFVGLLWAGELGPGTVRCRGPKNDRLPDGCQLQRLWFGADDCGLVAGTVGSVAMNGVSNQPMIAV